MGVVMEIRVQGMDEWLLKLDGINPQKNPRPIINALDKGAAVVQENVASEQIVGGRGKAPPLPTRLTNRHGGSGLVGSIRVNRAPLPRAIEIGTDKGYGIVHELGGTFNKRSSKGKSFTATYPARPFLRPGLKASEPRILRIFAAEIAREIAR